MLFEKTSCILKSSKIAERFVKELSFSFGWMGDTSISFLSTYISSFPEDVFSYWYIISCTGFVWHNEGHM